MKVFFSVGHPKNEKSKKEEKTLECLRGIVVGPRCKLILHNWKDKFKWMFILRMVVELSSSNEAYEEHSDGLLSIWKYSHFPQSSF